MRRAAVIVTLCALACAPSGKQPEESPMAESNPPSTVAVPPSDAGKCYDPLAAPPDAAKRDPIEYIVQFNEPETHYVDVAAHFPTDGAATLELMLPVRTPGSYMVREYARNIEAAAASTTDGAVLPMAKTAKNRWRVTTNGAKTVLVRYRVYGHELTVRNNWIERDFALLNGAATFMTIAGGEPGRTTSAWCRTAAGGRR
jgi:hypothetical protein